MHWQLISWIVGLILALAWFSRILDAALGMPRVADVANPEWDLHPQTQPRVSIIVPARNEEAEIEQSLTSLLALDYDNYEVIAVNDRSIDHTGELMERVAAAPSASRILKIIHVSELPPRWLGKTHAMWRAAQQATGDWLLFTDADVTFRSDSLRRVLAYAETERADHVVLFPRIVTKRPGERMMVAFFQTLFVFGHRPWKTADPDARDHMGVGAFNMVRRPVYDAVGTYERLRLEVLDDMKLGKVVKKAGFQQRNVFGDDLISLHWAKGAMGMVRNLTKNFFAVLSFQWWRVLASCFGLAFLNLLPFVGIWLVQGWARVPYAIALLSMFGIYGGMSRRAPIPSYYLFLHPISTVLFLYILMRSMCVTLWQRGVVWRGTKYPLEELRRGMV
jgi:cellulose synthase/poly-beta-1,6-N-acetylglucosamine synthase-like glycosyltransferase